VRVRLPRLRRRTPRRPAGDWGAVGGRRATRVRRRRTLRALRCGALALAVLGLLGWGLWLLGHMPAMRLSRVQVRGLKALSERQVLGRARLRPGDSLIGPDLWRAARRIKALPEVRRVSMDRDLPGAVVIRVQERTPREFVKTTGGVVSIDADGTAWSARKTPTAGAVEILGIPAGEVRPGRKVAGAHIEKARSALSVLRARQLIVRRLRLQGDQVQALLAGNTVVWFGSSDNLAEKADRLRQALGRMQRPGERIASIDLRDPDRIVWRSVRSGPQG
jgi:cell division protein FtsQ